MVCDRDLGRNGTRKKKTKRPATTSWVIPSVSLSKEAPGGDWRKSSSRGSTQTLFNWFDSSWDSSGVPVDELVCHCPWAASPALPNCAIYLLYLCIRSCRANGPLWSLRESKLSRLGSAEVTVFKIRCCCFGFFFHFLLWYLKRVAYFVRCLTGMLLLCYLFTRLKIWLYAEVYWIILCNKVTASHS